MNRLSNFQRARFVSALVEVNSVRSIWRMTRMTKGIVLKLLIDLGAACARYQFYKLKKLSCNKLQVDEIWSYRYAKLTHCQPKILARRISLMIEFPQIYSFKSEP